jgi:hypothetical protein
MAMTMAMMTFTPAADSATENEVVIVEPVLYTTQASGDVQLSDTPLSNVATFYGLNARVELGTFETTQELDASQPSAAEQLSAHASGDWFVASKEADAPALKKTVNVDWKGALNRFVTFLNKDKAAQPNIAEFSVRQPSRGVRE